MSESVLHGGEGGGKVLQRDTLGYGRGQALIAVSKGAIAAMSVHGSPSPGSSGEMGLTLRYNLSSCVITVGTKLVVPISTNRLATSSSPSVYFSSASGSFRSISLKSIP